MGSLVELPSILSLLLHLESIQWLPGVRRDHPAAISSTIHNVKLRHFTLYAISEVRQLDVKR